MNEYINEVVEALNAINEHTLDPTEKDGVITIFFGGEDGPKRIEAELSVNMWCITLINTLYDDEGVYLDTMLCGPDASGPALVAEPRVVAQFLYRLWCVIA